jgi:uncharacterized membrane protein YoaK (UPF0700 family)
VLGGTGLAALAGYVNACMLALFHVPVSHTTGAVTRAGLDLVVGDRGDLFVALGVLGGFFGGAVLSGLIVGGREIRVGRRYGVALVVEAGVLLAASGLAGRGAVAALPVAAFACGLQNAMASSYRGLVVRTTHTTGLITDLGIHLGRLMRGDEVGRRPFFLLLFLVLGFTAGVVAGGFAAHGGSPRPDALAWAAWPTLAVGLVYWGLRQRELRRRGRDGQAGEL